LADLLSKCGLNWARTVGFVSDGALTVISKSNYCSIIEKEGIVEKNFFRRLHCIIYEETLFAKRLKVTGLLDTCQNNEFYSCT
jgi:hypothetical protein